MSCGDRVCMRVLALSTLTTVLENTVGNYNSSNTNFVINGNGLWDVWGV